MKAEATWVIIAITLIGMVIAAAQEYGSIKTRIEYLEKQNNYMHGSIQLPKE